MGKEEFKQLVQDKASIQISRLGKITENLPSDEAKIKRIELYVNRIGNILKGEESFGLSDEEKREVIILLLVGEVFPLQITYIVEQIVKGEEKKDDSINVLKELSEIEVLFTQIKGSLEQKMRTTFTNVNGLIILLKRQNLKGSTPELVERIKVYKNKLNMEAIEVDMALESFNESEIKVMEDILEKIDDLIDFLNKSSSPIDTKAGWNDLRPENRTSWAPNDYFEALSQANATLDIVKLDGGAGLRAEFDSLVSNHPDYREDRDYWMTKLKAEKVLWEVNPDSGADGFTMSHNAAIEKQIHNMGYDVDDVGLIMRHKEYGAAAIRIMALLEIIQRDDMFSYYINGRPIVKRGQFVARNMDKRSGELQDALKEIVHDNHWLEIYSIPKELSLVDTIFRSGNALGMRDHFFLDDSASSVTKGFGDDFTWLSRPEATIGYDVDRYGREPKANWYFLAGVRMPMIWHKRVAYNEVFSLAAPKFLSVKGSHKEPCIKWYAERYSVSINKAKAICGKFETDNQLNIAKEYAFEKVAKKREIQSKNTVDNIRDWFSILISDEDAKVCLKKAYDTKKDGYEETPFDMIDGELYFRDKGATFPSIYQFYMSQMVKSVPDNGKIASAGLDRDTIFLKSLNMDEKIKRPEGKDNGFQSYRIAQKGWLSVINMLKEKPKPLDSESLIDNIDTFTAHLGKAKIVDGAHHNMMNVILFLYLVKQFKFLEPRTILVFEAARNEVLKKFQDTEETRVGGGVPTHVAKYGAWLLSEAKGGKMLRPMDPSMSELVDDKVHHETRGLKHGIGKTFVGGMAALEAIFEDFDSSKSKGEESSLGKAKEIPLGHITWDDQDVSTNKN